MIDIEDLTVKVSKDIEHFQTRYHLNQQEMTDLLLTLGFDSFMKDFAQRQLNGNRIPYLAYWHLRLGAKYYNQDLGDK